MNNITTLDQVVLAVDIILFSTVVVLSTIIIGKVTIEKFKPSGR